MANSGSSEVGTRYFSREFPSDVEVEWKGDVATIAEPVRLITSLDARLEEGAAPGFTRLRALGSRSTAIAFLGVINHYYGHRDSSGRLRQAFALMQLPGGEKFAPHVKFDDGSARNRAFGNILLRHETTKPSIRSFVPMDQREAFVRGFGEQEGVELEYVGSVHRERASMFVANTTTHRNWSVVADVTRPLDGSSAALGQVEVEYKGRSGVELEYNPASQIEAIEELRMLGGAIMDMADGAITPTQQTKFDWLVQHNQGTGVGVF